EAVADRSETHFHHILEARSGEDVELVVAHGFDHARTHHIRIETRFDRLGNHLAALGIETFLFGARKACLLGARAFVDARAHEAGAENRHADIAAPKLHRPPLAHRNDGIFGGRIRLHAGAADKALNRRRVDEVTAFAMTADQRQEGLDAVIDALQIDIDDPVPIAFRHLADLAAGADTGVVA